MNQYNDAAMAADAEAALEALNHHAIALLTMSQLPIQRPVVTTTMIMMWQESVMPQHRRW